MENSRSKLAMQNNRWFGFDLSSTDFKYHDSIHKELDLFILFVQISANNPILKRWKIGLLWNYICGASSEFVIMEMSPYSFGYFLKLSFYNCFMPI